MNVEVNAAFEKANDIIDTGGTLLMVTPPLTEDYWIARVVLHRDQAIVCFPKFGTIGCGFAQEEDWNTNLPLGEPAEEIYAHIKHNKKYAEITDQQCLEAIRALQACVPHRKRPPRTHSAAPEHPDAAND